MEEREDKREDLKDRTVKRYKVKLIKWVVKELREKQREIIQEFIQWNEQL